MKFKVLNLSTALVAVLGFASFAVAQDGSSAQTAPQTQERSFRRHHGGRMHIFAKLNLTEAQQAQIRQIHENAKNNFAGREEYKQLKSQQRSGAQLTAEQTARLNELREQKRQSKEQTRAQIAAVLTAEQSAQLETLKAERKQNRGDFAFGGRSRRGFGGFNRLNLTEAQQQQLRALNETVFNSTKAQREELRSLYEQRRSGAQLTAEQTARANELRQQLRQSIEQMRANLQTVLTPEQRQQLETQREQMRQRFQERRQLRQNSVQTPVK